MPDLPEEAMEAASKTYFENESDRKWADRNEDQRETYRVCMRPALEAAAPAIRKQERERVWEALATPEAVEAFNRALPGCVRHSTVDTIMAFKAALDTLEDSDG